MPQSAPNPTLAATPPIASWACPRCLACLFSHTAGRVYWLANIAALLAIVGWICLDGLFRQTASGAGHILEGWPHPLPPLLVPRVYTLIGILFFAALTLGGILLTIFIGDRAHRGIRSWLLAMLVVAAWLTLSLEWPALAWKAQAWRLRASLPEFEILASALIEDWPTDDGQIPGLGPFMAYPVGKPTTLMFMNSPTVPDANLAFGTVELSDEHVVHFQLVGNEEGAWLVRHPDATEPIAYYSGLSGEYTPFRFQALGNGWFLVEYSFAQLWDGLPDTQIIR